MERTNRVSLAHWLAVFLLSAPCWNALAADLPTVDLGYVTQQTSAYNVRFPLSALTCHS